MKAKIYEALAIVGVMIVVILMLGVVGGYEKGILTLPGFYCAWFTALAIIVALVVGHKYIQKKERDKDDKEDV